MTSYFAKLLPCIPGYEGLCSDGKKEDQAGVLSFYLKMQQFLYVLFMWVPQNKDHREVRQ